MTGELLEYRNYRSLGTEEPDRCGADDSDISSESPRKSALISASYSQRCQFSQAYTYYSPAGIDLQYQSVTITYLSRKNASIEDAVRSNRVLYSQPANQQDQPQDVAYSSILPKPR